VLSFVTSSLGSTQPVMHAAADHSLQHPGHRLRLRWRLPELVTAILRLRGCEPELDNTAHDSLGQTRQRSSTQASQP